MNKENNKKVAGVCSTNSMITALAVLVAIAAVFYAGMMHGKNNMLAGDIGGGGTDTAGTDTYNPPAPAYAEIYRSLAKDAGLSKTQIEECLAPGSAAQQTVDQHIDDAQKMGVNGTPGSFLVNTKTSAVQSIPGALPVAEVEKLLQEVMNQEGVTAEGADLSLLQIRDNDIVRGNNDILLIEYSDYECPFCQRFHGTAQTLVDTNQVAWVYRHLPLPFHATAKDGAIIGECVRIHKGMEAAWRYTDGVFK